jgi:hypothetical protein
MNENVLGIAAPALYRCQIHRYYSGLSRLYLRLFKGQADLPAFYVLFADVGYIDAPVNWQSADFQIAPKQDCIDLMLKTGLVGPAILQFPDAYAAVTDYARLYVARGTTVRIIASSASLLTDLPPDLK